jgi:hypothetical protein
VEGEAAALGGGGGGGAMLRKPTLRLARALSLFPPHSSAPPGQQPPPPPPSSENDGSTGDCDADSARGGRLSSVAALQRCRRRQWLGGPPAYLSSPVDPPTPRGGGKSLLPRVHWVAVPKALRARRVNRRRRGQLGALG